MTSGKNDNRSQPVVEYKPAEDSGGLLDKAFDILFEETLSKFGNLTTNDI